MAGTYKKSTFSLLPVVSRYLTFIYLKIPPRNLAFFTIKSPSATQRKLSKNKTRQKKKKFQKEANTLCLFLPNYTLK